MRTAFKGLMASLLLSLPMIASAQETAQDRASVLILDASGSMWSQLDDGTSRIEVARDVLSDFLAARDPAQPLGVIAYGHTRKGDCTDIEVLAPVGQQDPAGLGARLRTLNPRGKTPWPTPCNWRRRKSQRPAKRRISFWSRTGWKPVVAISARSRPVWPRWASLCARMWWDLA